MWSHLEKHLCFLPIITITFDFFEKVRICIMYELTNREFETVSGGLSVAISGTVPLYSLYGMVAGYSQFNLGSTAVLGAAFSCASTLPKLINLDADLGTKAMAMTISGLMSAGQTYIGYCTGVGIAHTFS